MVSALLHKLQDLVDLPDRTNHTIDDRCGTARVYIRLRTRRTAPPKCLPSRQGCGTIGRRQNENRPGQASISVHRRNSRSPSHAVVLRLWSQRSMDWRRTVTNGQDSVLDVARGGSRIYLLKRSLSGYDGLRRTRRGLILQLRSWRKACDHHVNRLPDRGCAVGRHAQCMQAIARSCVTDGPVLSVPLSWWTSLRRLHTLCLGSDQQAPAQIWGQHVTLGAPCPRRFPHKASC